MTADVSTRPAGKVLLVDDDPILRKMLEARLAKFGFQTVFAVDGASAVLAARREQPDVILLDLGLPAGDGFLVMNQVRQLPRLSNVPIIIVSASDTMTDARAAAVGAQGFLKKPVDYTMLLVAIRRVLPSTPAFRK
jgi:CheY-like chemotaxis protein